MRIGIMGGGGSGKTFCATQLAAAFADVGTKVLIVGCDSKPTLSHGLTQLPIKPLVAAMAESDFNPQKCDFTPCFVQRGNYLSIAELGAGLMLHGHQQRLLEELLLAFDHQQQWKKYEVVIFDITDERYDAALAPLLFALDHIIGTTTGRHGMLYSLNRLLRAVLLAGEKAPRPRFLGALGCCMNTVTAFTQWAKITGVPVLGVIPQDAQLADLFVQQQSIFTLSPRTPVVSQLLRTMVTITDLLHTPKSVIRPLAPLPDDDPRLWPTPKRALEPSGPVLPTPTPTYLTLN